MFIFKFFGFIFIAALALFGFFFVFSALLLLRGILFRSLKKKIFTGNKSTENKSYNSNTKTTIQTIEAEYTVLADKDK
jgi:hypothetical protein